MIWCEGFMNRRKCRSIFVVSDAMTYAFGERTGVLQKVGIVR